jgi:hypothetical protein
MVGKRFQLTATFEDQQLHMNQKNIVGDIVESLTFLQLKKHNIDVIRTPPQSSPDFITSTDYYGYEHKCFTNQPSFDIGNFESYVSQLCQPNGVEKKIFRTKYLIFEYSSGIEHICLERFYMMNVWNLVRYNGKYPLSLQVRRGSWQSIRPGSVFDWQNPQKTPWLFIDSLLTCIERCPNMQDKDYKIRRILDQCEALQTYNYSL